MPIAPENVKSMSVWFTMPIEEALKKVASFAGVMEASVEEYTKVFKEQREAHEKAEAAKKLREHQAELVKAINGQAIADLDEALLVEASKNGVLLRISTELSQDGQDVAVVEATVGAQASTRTRGPLVIGGSPQQFQYFHNGQPLAQGERLAPHILANYPNSVAAATLKSYKDKANKSKLGAWQAVQRDQELAAVYTRTPKVSV